MSDAGPEAIRGYRRFLSHTNKQQNTRAAYRRAFLAFCDWTDKRRYGFGALTPSAIESYFCSLRRRRAISTVQQHFSALRAAFDAFTARQVIPFNPTRSLRPPPRPAARRPPMVISDAEARRLIATIDVGTPAGQRDRVVIAFILYAFTSVAATVALDVVHCRDTPFGLSLCLSYGQQRTLEAPAHPILARYIAEYLRVTGLKRGPLLRSIDRSSGGLSAKRLTRLDILRIVKRRAAVAGLSPKIDARTLRASAIKIFRANGGSIEAVQALAGYLSAGSVQRFDAPSSERLLDELQRFAI